MSSGRLPASGRLGARWDAGPGSERDAGLGSERDAGPGARPGAGQGIAAERKLRLQQDGPAFWDKAGRPTEGPRGDTIGSEV